MQPPPLRCWFGTVFSCCLWCSACPCEAEAWRSLMMRNDPWGAGLPFLADRRSFGKQILAVTTTTYSPAVVLVILATTATTPSVVYGSDLVVETTARTTDSTETPDSFPTNNLQRRLEDTILEKPPLVAIPRTLSGMDNLYYPDFLAGTWNVTQTLTGVQTPLGVAFLNPNVNTAQRSFAEAQSKLKRPVKLQLRFVPTRWGVAEDRVFNTAQRLNAFAGRTVVASVSYADVGASNREAVLRQGGTEQDPLSTVLVRFKGPAAQKIFVTSHASLDCSSAEDGGGQAASSSSPCWVASESQRSIFALTNENTAPPVFTDSEVLYEFKKNPNNTPSNDEKRRVSGRLRIASYLNPMDKLYFDARNRAVSVQDYTLEMQKVAP